MVGFCLVSYSVGCISLNLLSFYFTTADSLMKAIAVIITIAVLPTFFFLQESPMFLYKTGQVSRLVTTLNKIAKRNNAKLPKNYFENQLRLETQGLDKDIVLERDISVNMDNPPQSPLHKLFFDREISMTLVALCVQSATIFMIYYGLTSSIGDLGLKSIQLNGILLGFTQLLGYLFMAYYGPTLKRVKAAKACLVIEILGALVLLGLSKCKQTDQILVIQSFVSTLWMTTTVSAHMSVLYMQNAESFPTEVRGLAIAFILLFGKMSGATAPFIEEYTKSLGVHVLVGCSCTAFLALPLVMTLKETLGTKKVN